MKTENTLRNTIIIILIGSISSGELSFYIAGGIPMLANDVGTDGAWMISMLYQLIYSMLLTISFVISYFINKYFNTFRMAIIPILAITIIISSSINFYGILNTKKNTDLEYFSFIVVAISFVAYYLVIFFSNSKKAKCQ